MADEQLMTKGEVASYFRVEVRTIDRWMQRGIIRYRRVGNRVRFVKSDVILALERGVESSSDPSLG